MCVCVSKKRNIEREANKRMVCLWFVYGLLLFMFLGLFMTLWFVVLGWFYGIIGMFTFTFV